MHISTYELEAWGAGHRALVAEDVQRAHNLQARLMQRLSQMMIKVGHQVVALGQRLQVPEDAMQLQN